MTNGFDSATVFAVGSFAGTVAGGGDGSVSSVAVGGVAGVSDVGGAEFCARGGGVLGFWPNQPAKPVKNKMPVPIRTSAAKAMSALVDRHQAPARK
jgi:hypothetical protein